MNRIIFNEVYAIIKNMEKIYIDMIDKDYLDFIKSNMIPEKEIKIDMKKSLLKQNLHPETFEMIAAINLEFWNKREDVQDYLINKYLKNDGGEKNA